MTDLVPLVDLNAAYDTRRGKLDAAVRRVMESGWYILGQEVEAFEREFAAFLGATGCVGAASGTDALELALRACDLPAGSGVIAPSHTAVATAVAIERAGLVPVLVDVQADAYTLDPKSVEETLQSGIGSEVRAIVPVHLYGQPADLPALLNLARRYGLRIVEDCAQAHGATLAGRPCGTWGDLAAFSFYPTKNLGAMGDGGAVVTSDAALAARVRSLRQYGWRDRYVSAEPGMNSRLDELQAAVLRVRLAHLADDNEARRGLAAAYAEALAGTRVECPTERAKGRHVYHLYVIQADWRDSLRSHLQRRGIGTGIHYPAAIHQQPAYRGRVRSGPGGLARTERLCSRILSLPMYPQMPPESVAKVAEAIRDWEKTGPARR